MDESSNQGSEGLSRRGLLRGGLLAGLGAAGLSVASSALAPGVARAADGVTTALLPSGASITFTYQADWRYCGNCRNLYYGGRSGACAIGQFMRTQHSAGSSTGYGVPDAAPIPGLSPYNSSPIQAPWRICYWCACLYWGPEEASSYCVGAVFTGGNTHSSYESGEYYMMNGTASTSWVQGGAQLQPGWRYCAYCKVLYWGNQQSNSLCQYEAELGTSATTLNHAPGNTVYFLFMNV